MGASLKDNVSVNRLANTRLKLNRDQDQVMTLKHPRHIHLLGKHTWHFNTVGCKNDPNRKPVGSHTTSKIFKWSLGRPIEQHQSVNWGAVCEL